MRKTLGQMQEVIKNHKFKGSAIKYWIGELDFENNPYPAEVMLDNETRKDLETIVQGLEVLAEYEEAGVQFEFTNYKTKG